MDLIDAAKNGNLETVLTILECGRAANIKDKDNATALYWSACHGHDDVTEVLISAGCEVDSAVRWGSTALHAAADRGHLKCVQMLIESGANPNSINNRGDLPLHIAAYRGFMEITNILLFAGSDVNLTNEKGKTPKQEALEGGNSDVAECIRVFELERRISTNTRESRYQTTALSHVPSRTIYCSTQSNNLPVAKNGWLPSISTESSDFNDSFASSMTSSEKSFPEDCVDSGTVPTRQTQNVQLRRSISFGGTHIANRNISPVDVALRTPSLENIPVVEPIHRNIHGPDHTHFKSEPLGRLRLRDTNVCQGGTVNTIDRKSAKQMKVNLVQQPYVCVDQSRVIDVVHTEADVLMRKYEPGFVETMRPARSSVGSVVDIVHKSRDTAVHLLQNQLVDSYKQIERLTKENEHLKFKSSTLLERLNETESQLSAMVLKSDTLAELLEVQNSCVNEDEHNNFVEKEDNADIKNSRGRFKELARRFEDMPNVLEERLRVSDIEPSWFSCLICRALLYVQVYQKDTFLCRTNVLDLIVDTIVDLFKGVPTRETDISVNEEWLPGSDYVILGDPPVSAPVNEKLPNFVSFLIRHLKRNKCYILKMKIVLNSNTPASIHPTIKTKPCSLKYLSQPNIIKVLHQFDSSTERHKKFIYIPPSRDQNLPQRLLAHKTTFLVTPSMITLRKILQMCTESKLISDDREVNLTFWIYVIYQLSSVLCVLEDRGKSVGCIDEDSIGFDEDLVPYVKDIENVIELHYSSVVDKNPVQENSPVNCEETSLSKINEKFLCSNDIPRLCTLFYNILFSTKAGSSPLFPVHGQPGNAPSQDMIHTEQALRHILSDAIQSPSHIFHEESTARNMCNRLGFVLFGSGLINPENEKECRLYHHSRMLELLSTKSSNKRQRQQGELMTLEESIHTNKMRIEAHFQSHVTSLDLWRYCRLFEHNGLFRR